MGETGNTSAIAEKLSHELFKDFYWNAIGRMNHNWECCNKENHEVKTHPSDVVFYYDEPYKNVRTYLQTDLKSYSAESVTKSSIEKAIVSLAKQVSCANISPEWQDEHTHEHQQFAIHGLLFIYNHDERYDKDFSELLDGIDYSSIKLPPDSRIYILGPSEINWLQLLKIQMQHYRGATSGFWLPSPEYCNFYYPQLSRKINIERRNINAAATMEMLLGPWVILKYDDKNGHKGLTIFYNRPGSTTTELVYLIDYLRHYQAFRIQSNVQIVFRHEFYEKALLNLQKAKQQYLEETQILDADSDLRACIENIEPLQFVRYSDSFSTYEIGMNYER